MIINEIISSQHVPIKNITLESGRIPCRRCQVCSKEKLQRKELTFVLNLVLEIKICSLKFIIVLEFGVGKLHLLSGM